MVRKRSGILHATAKGKTSQKQRLKLNSKKWTLDVPLLRTKVVHLKYISFSFDLGLFIDAVS